MSGTWVHGPRRSWKLACVSGGFDPRPPPGSAPEPRWGLPSPRPPLMSPLTNSWLRPCTEATDLAADHDGAGGNRVARVLLDAIVQRNDVQNVQQLSFVLVDSLHLNVEHRRRVDHDVELLVNVGRQLHLVLLFDKHHRQRLCQKCSCLFWGSKRR